MVTQSPVWGYKQIVASAEPAIIYAEPPDNL